jgi:hypothetical protein
MRFAILTTWFSKPHVTFCLYTWYFCDVSATINSSFEFLFISGIWRSVYRNYSRHKFHSNRIKVTQNSFAVQLMEFGYSKRRTFHLFSFYVDSTVWESIGHKSIHLIKTVFLKAKNKALKDRQCWTARGMQSLHVAMWTYVPFPTPLCHILPRICKLRTQHYVMKSVYWRQFHLLTEKCTACKHTSHLRNIR